jgi:hypothetical protein
MNRSQLLFTGAFCVSLLALQSERSSAQSGTGADDIVLTAAEATDIHGHWSRATDPTASQGQLLTSTDTGWQNTGYAVAAPAHYVDFTFTPAPNTPYRVWLRLRAPGGSKYNDSVFVQFSNATDPAGKPRYRVGSTDGLMVNLQSCNGCALDGWGWINSAYWTWQVNTVVFTSGESQTMRVQTREDGVEIDQIVLSPAAYLNAAPGAVTADTITLPCDLPRISTPRSVPAPIPGTIAAAEFDEGGPAVAYHDTTSGNTGGAHRSTNVDLQVFAGSTPTVGWIAAGEWLNYTVDVAASGVYELDASVASLGQGGVFHVNFGDNNATGSLQIPNTGGWSNWTSVKTLVTLDAGVQIMKVLFDSPAATVGNLASIRLSPHVPRPEPGSLVSLPGPIRPEQFDLGGAAISYYDTTPGNSGGAYRDTDVDIESAGGSAYAITSIAAGEWLEYGVNVTRSMDYVIEFDVASMVDSGRMRAQFAAAATPQISVPNTGGSWTTIAMPIALTAGDQIMRLAFDGGEFSLRAIRVERAAKTLVVAAGGNVQAALHAAELGDTIVLEAGATYVGNFVLPVKSGQGYVTIRSSAPDALLPGEGVRINPSYAAYLPKLKSPTSVPALSTEAGAHHYRLQFLEFLANAQGYGTIVALGDGSKMQNSLELVPHDLILDRVYIHGDVTLGQKRAIALNSAATTIVNSYISEIKAAGQDSQAIAGWNGPGPFVISNNYLEAAAENVLFGGADPGIPGLVPSDITFTHNHLFKPLSWRGSKWTVKNLFELKSAQRVVVDSNLMENNWLAAQAGYAILLKSLNQEGGAPWSVVQDVVFTNNVIRHVSSAINIRGIDGPYPSVEANRITFRNNLFEDISGVRYGGVGRFLLINGGKDITFTHNTAFNDGSITIFPDLNPTSGFVFNDNIIQDNAYGIKGAGLAVGNATIAKWFPGGQFVGGIYIGAKATLYPAANFFPANTAAVGFVDAANGDYRLAETGLYCGSATDGSNPGVDIAALAAAYEAVRR